jgi:hypothetical protein
MMSLSGAKTQNFFATAILVSAVVLCWSAEAAPKNLGHKQMVRNASPDITTQIGKNTDTVTCYVYTKSDENICVVYDVYPVWYFSRTWNGIALYSGKNRAQHCLGVPLPTGINAVQTCFSKIHALARSVSVAPLSYGTTGWNFLAMCPDALCAYSAP